MTAQPASLSTIVAATVCTLLADPAAGQPNPGRQIKMVVPVAPGGPFDALARAMAEQIGRAQGATMLIENRPGGGTVIASEAVSRAAPDGSTILFMANSFVINPHMKKLSYDPLTSFEPICYLVRSPHVLVVNPASPYRTLADLVGAARAKPGELTMAANGPATAHHVGFEILKRAANFNMTFVPYSGSTPAVTALLGAHVTAALADYSTVAAHIKTGTLRALAVGTRVRIDALPDVPAIAEIACGRGVRRLARHRRPGEDAARNGFPALGLVHGGAARARREGTAREPGALPGCDMRCGFQRLHPQASRRVRPHRPRSRHQGTVRPSCDPRR